MGPGRCPLAPGGAGGWRGSAGRGGRTRAARLDRARANPGKARRGPRGPALGFARGPGPDAEQLHHEPRHAGDHRRPPRARGGLVPAAPANPRAGAGEPTSPGPFPCGQACGATRLVTAGSKEPPRGREATCPFLQHRRGRWGTGRGCLGGSGPPHPTHLRPDSPGVATARQGSRPVRPQNHP